MIAKGVKGESIAIHEVTGGDPAHLEKYLEIYSDFFPYYDYYVPYMRHRGQQPADADPRFVEHWWLVEIDGEPAAIREFKYVPARDCGVAMIIAIKPAYRRLATERFPSLAQHLVEASLEQLKADAARLGRPIPVGMVGELQLPETAESEEVARFRQRLINTWHRFGYVDLPVEYYEPPFVQGTEEFIAPAVVEERDYLRLLLGVFPIEGGGFDPSSPALIARLVVAILIDHYGLPEDHWVVRRAIESIGERL